MAKKKKKTSDIAVVDSSVFFRLGLDPVGAEGREQFERAKDAIRSLEDAGVEFVVPAPVYAELAGSKAATLVDEMQEGIEIAPFDLPAAVIVGKRLRAALRDRPPGVSRHCLKVDLMIAATAHLLDAQYVVTANPRDFVKELAAMGSSAEVYDIDAPPGQQRMALRMPAVDE